jgi:hypothetical protein
MLLESARVKAVRRTFIKLSPDHPKSHGLEVDSPISLLDIFPTILEWSNASLPKTKNNLRWTGKSVLPFLGASQGRNSQNFLSKFVRFLYFWALKSLDY